MKSHFTKLFRVMFIGTLFASCNTSQTVDTSSNTETLPAPSNESTPTKLSISTVSPINTSTLTPIVTPLTPTFAQATIDAFGPLCVNSKNILGSEISPDGQWIAAECYWENETEDSPLQVVSMDHSIDWKIYFRDYAKSDKEYSRRDGLMPYHWSKDGRFLYAVAGSRLSGCCWIGGRYILLVRLNLETGEVTELLNATKFSSGFTFDIMVSDSDRYLLFTAPTNQPYDFAILDLLTWKTQTITLEFPKDIDLTYAVISPEEDKIVMPLFRQLEFNDFIVDSIVLIDLTTGKQKLLISDLKQGKELFPARWVDENQVLLSNTRPPELINQESAEYWLLNIYTGELEQADKP